MLEEMGIDSKEMRRFQERLTGLMEEMGEVPPVDIEERDDDFVITVDLPGVDKNDVEVTITEDGLRLKARRELKEGSYFLRERRGSFERIVTLPAEVRVEEAKAKLKDGVLEIVVPKIVSAKKRIAIE
ncbi:MAG: Hsp20/alpha crystallin family protein [Methanothrix sp.]|nr:Hsp20/alpha crystallin family protein [Methanothrix sp.]